MLPRSGNDVDNRPVCRGNYIVDGDQKQRLKPLYLREYSIQKARLENQYFAKKNLKCSLQTCYRVELIGIFNLFFRKPPMTNVCVYRYVGDFAVAFLCGFRHIA
jgi:hypothetical protein